MSEMTTGTMIGVAGSFAAVIFLSVFMEPPKAIKPTVIVEYWGPDWDPAKKYKTWTNEKEMTRILEKGRYYIKCKTNQTKSGYGNR